MRSTLIVGILVALAVLAPVGAQQPEPGADGYTLYGVGAKSCGKWLEQRTGSSTKFINSAWVHGFVSAIGSVGQTLKKTNPAGMYTLKQTDTAGIRAFVDQYCDAHRTDNIADAAHALVRELVVKKAP